uniref:Transmembrane protein n=1 Tax=Leptobrachium leishanense TaxID=445787 RepID=A0A8C5MHW4_9ANUR
MPLIRFTIKGTANIKADPLLHLKPRALCLDPQCSPKGNHPGAASAIRFSLTHGVLSCLLHSCSSHCMVLRKVFVFSFSFSYFFFHCSAVSSTFTHTVFLIVFALKKTKKISLGGGLFTKH